MKPKEIYEESKRPRSELPEGKEIINREHPYQPVSVGTAFPQTTRQEFIELLKKYRHVFSWTPTYMVGVDRGVIEHKLMIRHRTKEINKKKCVQEGGPEQGDQCRSDQADQGQNSPGGNFSNVDRYPDHG